MSAPRLILVLAIALTILTGAAYLASRTVLAPHSSDAGASSQYVAAPTPVRARTDVPAGAPLGTPRVDSEWLADTADAAGLPVPALRAYAGAQLSGSDGCEVGWTTLAGIGWVESQHGTLGGRTLERDGRSSTPILGPALDGSGSFAAIPATPGSRRWHGDPHWEHAVGPMQFLPSSWETWGTDGDGDGRADPHDLDDAAVAAARYLCADGHDLATRAGWTQAVFDYNHAQEYVDAVHEAASDYAERAD